MKRGEKLMLWLNGRGIEWQIVDKINQDTKYAFKINDEYMIVAKDTREVAAPLYFWFNSKSSLEYSELEFINVFNYISDHLDYLRKDYDSNLIFVKMSSDLMEREEFDIPVFEDDKWGEPEPTDGEESVTDAVLKDLESRRELGIGKYGTELKTNNGRNALKDAYEEALDLACYLKQRLMEEQDGKQV